MSISRNWMVEDNISMFGEHEKKRRLYNFLDECISAIFTSCDGGRRFKSPGQAVSWYLDRIVDEDHKKFIRENLRPEHLNALWSEHTKMIIEDNDHRDRLQKYPRRGTDTVLKEVRK